MGALGLPARAPAWHRRLRGLRIVRRHAGRPLRQPYEYGGSYLFDDYGYSFPFDGFDGSSGGNSNGSGYHTYEAIKEAAGDLPSEIRGR